MFSSNLGWAIEVATHRADVDPDFRLLLLTSASQALSLILGQNVDVGTEITFTEKNADEIVGYAAGKIITLDKATFRLSRSQAELEEILHAKPRPNSLKR